jgi:16S rRNA (cytosine967-C5)-methyltransferase
MDRVPIRAAVHETVQLSRRFGHAGTARLTNGVLRTLLRQHQTYQLPKAKAEPVAHLAISYSHPEWLVARWLQRYGWDNRPSRVTLRTNMLRTSPTQLAEHLKQEGIVDIQTSELLPEALIVRGSNRLDALPSYQHGLFLAQDQAAMLVAPLCCPEPGHRVLDVCAAPGGKTTHLAQLMRDKGIIVACDMNPGRLRMLRHHILRLELSSIVTAVMDATNSPIQGKFDRILVDAPCSGLGVLRHHPDIKWRKSPQDLTALQSTQLNLLHIQHGLLAPNGIMVYSVCSNEPEETHDVVTQFLTAHPDMQLDTIMSDLPPALAQQTKTSRYLELTPEQWQTDGVFVARFRRQTSVF